MAWRPAYDWAVAGLLAVVAAIVRMVGLGRPASLVFDETFYVPDARRYLDTLQGGEVSWVHPPLGKWFIAWGIDLFGDDPAGWRSATVVAGVATVVFTFFLGRRLAGPVVGSLAGLFVAFDGLAIVQSRTAMLDGLMVPLLLGAVLLVVPIPDRASGREPGMADRWVTTRLVAAGALLGAAVAVKWSAAPVLLAVAIVAGLRLRPRTARDISVVGVAFTVVPALVYLGSYARFWADNGADVAGLVRSHQSMLDYHQTLDVTHTYESTAPSWLLLRRPVSYFFERGDGSVTEILALGNPALWWGFLIALPWLAWRWWTSEDRVTAQTTGAVVVALATLYVPWLVTARPGFLFYMTPVVPFMAIGLAFALVQLWRWSAPSRWLAPLRWAAPALPLVIVAVGVAYMPLWIGDPVSVDRWDALILFDTWI